MTADGDVRLRLPIHQHSAALKRPGAVTSRCERSGEPLGLDVCVTDAPDSSDAWDTQADTFG